MASVTSNPDIPECPICMDSPANIPFHRLVTAFIFSEAIEMASPPDVETAAKTHVVCSECLRHLDKCPICRGTVDLGTLRIAAEAEKRAWVDYIAQNGAEVDQAPQYLRNQSSFWVAILCRNIAIVPQIPRRFLTREFYLDAIASNQLLYQYLPGPLKEDESFHLDLIEKQPELFPYLDEFVGNSRGGSQDKILQVLDQEVPANSPFKEVCLQGIARNERVFFLFIPETWKQNRAFCLEAMKANPNVFTLLPEEFQNDRAFCLDAIAKNHRVLTVLLAANDSKIDASFLFESVRRNGEAIEVIRVRCDKSIYSQAFSHIRNPLRKLSYLLLT